MTRGHRDSLSLRCRAFSSPSPYRFIPALSRTTGTPSERLQPRVRIVRSRRSWRSDAWQSASPRRRWGTPRRLGSAAGLGSLPQPGPKRSRVSSEPVSAHAPSSRTSAFGVPALAGWMGSGCRRWVQSCHSRNQSRVGDQHFVADRRSGQPGRGIHPTARSRARLRSGLFTAGSAAS
jgi:hypothetical protein